MVANVSTVDSTTIVHDATAGESSPTASPRADGGRAAASASSGNAGARYQP